MQIAICDDEKEVREMLAQRVQRLCPQAIVSVYASGEELLMSLPYVQPDILLLDIQMAGTGGMETARAFRRQNKRAILIFVTALEEYVFQAFDVGAFHYLIKPFDNKKFVEVLLRAVEELEGRKKEERQDSRREMPNIMVTTGGKHIAIHPEDIVYAEVFDRKVIIHTLDSDIEYYGKMKELAKQVGEDFYRPHRAYLVNFGFITKYDATTIYLEKGQAMMAKQNYPDFVKSYLKYNQMKGSQQV